MASTTPANADRFKGILCHLLSSDNKTRTNAENQLEAIPSSERFFLLLSAISDDQIQVEEAELCAVVLRRLITTEYDEVFAKLSPAVQEQVKKQLLLRVQQDTDKNLKRKICDVAAELARYCIDEEGKNHWHDFLQNLFVTVQSPDPFKREIALLMFASVPGVFGNSQDQYMNLIHQMLYQNLGNDQIIEVRLVAMRATCAFLLVNDKEVKVQKTFTNCVNRLLEFLSEMMGCRDGQIDDILRNLIELIEACPQTFRPHIDYLFQLALKGISNAEYLESCNQLSLEVLVTMCESAAPMVKKLAAKHIPTIISLVLKMMTAVEDDPNWSVVDDDNSDEDSDSPPVVGEASLDRLACALGGKAVLPLVFNSLPHMLNSSEWKERYAGLMAISAVGEGCHKQMSALLVQIVEGVLPFLIDQHPRVQYAACNALGQMSTDFAPTFQKKFSEKIIPSLLELFHHSLSPRVQAHAGAALVNFFEDCPKHVLEPYMDTIIHRLEAVLNSKLQELVEKGTKLVLEQVVVTLAALADSAEDKFSVYYDKFMPCLKFIVQNAVQPDLRLLRGKTIECISLIGLAVGKEKFLSDASAVMNLLLESQSSSPPLAEDDPQLSYMIAAWARICKILGKAFEPYLPFVMGPVLKAAAIKPEIAVIDTDEIKNLGNEDDWEFVNLGEKHNFGIRTAGLDEKATACQMLVCYARELKEGFADYVEETVKLMVPMLKFYFHDNVRLSAGEILPCLLESAKVRGEHYVKEMWRFILPSLLGALDSEPECEVLCEHMGAFSQCIEVMGDQSMQPEDFKCLLAILDRNLNNHFENQDAREKRKDDEDYDEVIEDTLMKEDDEDVYLLSKISEMLCTFINVYQQNFFVYFDMLLPHYIKLLEPSRPYTDRQWALCVFADVIECLGTSCNSYQQYFLEPLVRGLNDKSADLRQTAAYTLGLLAQFGGPEYAALCSETLPLLVGLISDPTARTEDNERSTENAISAVTKMIVYNNSLINIELMLPLWFQWLPVWEDDEEAKHIYSYLCMQLENNNTNMLIKEGDEVQDVLKRVMYIVADAYLKHFIEPSSDLGKRMLALVQEIYLKDNTLFEICLQPLSSEHQTSLREALNPQH